MRREVPDPLSNEKVTYIEFQDDLWVTFDPWLFIFQCGLLGPYTTHPTPILLLCAPYNPTIIVVPLD